MHRRDFHHDVNAVQQRPGDPAPVLVDRPLGAAAATGRIAVPTTLAGVHGADQHEFRRIGHGAGDSGNGNFSILQRLAHHIQCILAELRQLIQEQHALVGHGDLAGPGIGTAARQARIGNGMVGRTERTAGDQRLLGRQLAHDGIDPADLQGFLPGHVRQDRGQALGKHALAGARRADEQHIVAACGGHLQGTLDILLSQHILEVQQVFRLGRRLPQGIWRQHTLAIEGLRQLPHIADAVDHGTSGESRLGGIFIRNKQGLHALVSGRQGHGQDAGYRPQLAVQTQLTDECAVRTGTAHAAGGGEDAQQNGKIIVGAAFLQAGGGQIDGDAADRKGQAAGLGRGADTLPGLLDGGVGQTDDVKGRKAVGNIAFGHDIDAPDAGDAQGADTADHFHYPPIFPILLI